MQKKIRQYIQRLNETKTNSKFRQVVLLYGVNIIGIPIGIITSIVVTRFLGPVEYGNYKFITTVFTLFVLLFSFGFFQAGNRALVLNNDDKKAKEFYGAELAITLGLYLIMASVLIIYGLYDPNLKEKGLSTFDTGGGIVISPEIRPGVKRAYVKCWHQFHLMQAHLVYCLSERLQANRLSSWENVRLMNASCSIASALVWNVLMTCIT